MSKKQPSGKTTRKAKPKAPTKRVGRPSSFAKIIENDRDQIAKLYQAGWTDKQVADFFGISETTLNNHKAKNPEFFDELKGWRADADAQVEKALYEKAIGFSHTETKFFFDKKTGDIHTRQTVVRHAPDTAAASFWLRNRRPDRWKDKQEVQHSGSLTIADALAAMEGDADE